jgi:predicted AAA+ superfamily ATPase
LESVVERANDTFPVVMVTGPRQVGKTTMLKKLATASRAYVSLDSPINREMARTEPELFLQRNPPPVLIDEFQYAKDLLVFVKLFVDSNNRNGNIWLTGSQMFHMMKNVSESLAGRAAIIHIQSLSNSEINGLPNSIFSYEINDWLARLKAHTPMDLLSIFNRIFKGSMPRCYSADIDREMFYSSYIDTYLQRDIRDLTQVADESAFLRFMTACAARTAQQVSYTELARDAGISAPTAKQWLSILITSGVIILVQPYFNNALKRIIKAPKLYFMDTGLCTYLTRWDSSKSLEASMMGGAIFETYAVSEIYKNYLNAGKRPPIYYYRDTDQNEIDIIIEANGMLHPFEIKKSAAPGRESIRHFSILAKTQKEIGPGGVICMADSVYPIDAKNCYIPVWLL